MEIATSSPSRKPHLGGAAVVNDGEVASHRDIERQLVHFATDGQSDISGIAPSAN
jgi:hypothetical protein